MDKLTLEKLNKLLKSAIALLDKETEAKDQVDLDLHPAELWPKKEIVRRIHMNANVPRRWRRRKIKNKIQL